MKVTRHSLSGEYTRWKYPCLAESDDVVVLFSRESEGIVISENSAYPIGYYSDTWIMKAFQLMNDEIRLKNN